MAAVQYRVVEAVWAANGREERDIGAEWKPLEKAKEDLRLKKLSQPSRVFSLQRKK